MITHIMGQFPHATLCGTRSIKDVGIAKVAKTGDTKYPWYPLPPTCKACILLHFNDPSKTAKV